MVITPQPPCMMKITGKKWILLLGWVATVLMAVIYLSNSLQVVSDVSQFMPKHTEQGHKLALMTTELMQGQTGRLIFIRISSRSTEDTAGLSKTLSQRLNSSRLFDTVLNGQSSFDIEDFQQLFDYRYLLNKDINSDVFTVNNIRQNLKDRLTEIRSGMGVITKHTLTADPTNSFIDYIKNAIQQGEPDKQNGVWFSDDRQWALLIATMTESGFDIDDQQQAIEYIRHSFDELSGSEYATIDITGPGTFAVATRQNIQKTLKLLSIAAGTLILLVLFLVYRSVTLVLLSGLPIITAILLAVCMTNFAFGYVHGITLAFGITLLGVCIDYPVHFFSHLRIDRPALQSLREIMPTMLMGVVTTGVGYSVLLMSGFEGLEQLAVFAVTGLGSALLVTRWVLPFMIGRSIKIKSRDNFCQLLQTGSNLRLLVLAAVIVGVGVIIVKGWQQGDIWEKDISALSPIPEHDRQLDRQLRHQLNAPDVNHIFIRSNKDPQLLLEQTEELTLSLHGLVIEGLAKKVYSPTDLLPSVKHQVQNRQNLPGKEALASMLNEAVSDTPFKAGIFKQFMDDVETSHELTPLTPEVIMQTPVGRIVRSDLFKRDEYWVSIIRLSGVDDENALMRWLIKYPELKQDYYNLRKQTSGLINTYANKILVWLMLGMCVMFAVLAIYSQSVSMAARVMLAPVMAVSASLGLQVLFNEHINLFHMLSVLLVVGIGIDYSLFFNRKVHDRIERSNTLHGVMVSATSTLIAFGVLAFSEIPVMQAIGQTVAVGVAASFLLAILLASQGMAQDRGGH